MDKTEKLLTLVVILTLAFLFYGLAVILSGCQTKHIHKGQLTTKTTTNEPTQIRTKS